MRKLLFILLLCVFHIIIVAQDTTMALPSKLPAEGILMDKGWKFQAGDNLEWATPIIMKTGGNQ